MNASAPFCSRFTDFNHDRKRQIDTVKVFNDNVSEVSPNSEYSVEFTSGENKLAMLILLGPDFPMEKPLLKITPSISHQWVNENSEIVSAPGYLNFSVYSDLGRVVQAIIREFQRNPPPVRQKESPLTYANRVKNHDTTETPSSSEEYEQSFEVMSSVISRLHKISLDELKKLNEDDKSLEQFVNELPHIQSLKQTVVCMINATDNLERNKSALELKISDCKVENEEQQKEFEVHKEKCKLLYDKYTKLAEIRAPVNVKKRLKQAAAALDAESESVAENFLDSNITLDGFLSQYKTLRMKVHEIKLREDRINKQIQMDKNNTS